ncbi:alpha/beta fold hydrolase [Nocardia puris]|uniref:alpha/beta fold hydrolase n=1 Tax=Nocardia puris TaxID=208602 RepID=UPI00350E49B0
MRRFRFQDSARLHTLPVTIAWGTRDRLLVYRTQSREARTRLPHSRHIAMPGCGHIPFYDDPQRCADAILEQLRESGVSPCRS